MPPLMNRDLRIFPKQLLILTIEGFDSGDPTKEDNRGTIEYFIRCFGMNENLDPTLRNRILAIDGKMPGRGFQVLIDSRDEENFQIDMASMFDRSNLPKGTRYRTKRTREVKDSMTFGDANANYKIMNHPDGWVIAKVI